MQTSILKSISIATMGLMLSAAPAFAETIEVQMVNQDPETGDRFVYEPAFIRAQPGDTIRFVSVDRGHNAASINGGLPEGVETFRSTFSQDFELEVTEDGTYLIQCTPHYALGMVAMVLVGDYSVNFEEAKEVRHRGQAAARFEALFEAAEMVDPASAERIMGVDMIDAEATSSTE